MTLISNFTRRVHKLARYIEQPHLWRLRQRGVSMEAYVQFNQPWWHSLGISTILDIGGNVGQFCMLANAVWPRAKIYTFEPLQDCFEELQAQFAGSKNVTAFNFGLGVDQGEVAFERSAFPASSSMLKMAELHKVNYPQSRDSQTVIVQIERLDDVARRLELNDALFVKIDVQGYEDRVLRGGEKTIRRARVVLLETSFQTLYEGQPLFEDIHRLMVQFGFSYAGSIEQAGSPIDGRILQADSIFVRRGDSGVGGA